MKLTMKGDYGLRAMLDLAAYYGQGPIESADIARRQYIPEQYLDQILMALRKEGLVKSIRGPKGGHACQTTSTDYYGPSHASSGRLCPTNGMPAQSRFLQALTRLCLTRSLAKDR